MHLKYNYYKDLNRKVNIELFKSNTDAEAVNRGFYYQYLLTLKKWIANFVDGKVTATYCEVDDDIKEVGSELIFTQVKCYSKNFRLTSPEVKKSLFHFYMLYLENSVRNLPSFFFTTNTSLAQNEKLLKAWIANPDLNEVELFNKVKQSIQKTLIEIVKSKKNKRLSHNSITEEERKEIKETADLVKGEIDSSKINDFVRSIKWEFLDLDPTAAVDKVTEDIDNLLLNSKFGSKPPYLIKSVLLSEVFRCSQLPLKEKRVLKNEKINEILNETEERLNSQIDNRLINIFNIKFDEIEGRLDLIEENQFGLENRVQNVEHKISSAFNPPKELTLIPSMTADFGHGLSEMIEVLQEKLAKKNHVSINGVGGFGKTFLIQSYINKYYDDFDHLIWIDASFNLDDSILLNKLLLENLKIKLDAPITIDRVLNELCKLQGKNLIVIDNYEKEKRTLQKVVSLRNWKILISTRQIISGLNNYKLPQIDNNIAKKIFNDNCSEDSKKEQLEKFLQFVNYNPLVIKLCAKTIENSYDVTLESLLKSLLNQELDDANLEIELDILEESAPITLLSYLKDKFNLNGLEVNERLYLSFLALLPSEFVDIDDLAMIGGMVYYEENLKTYTNWTNSLHSKGWIERDGRKIKLHKLVQEIIIYNEKEHISPFIGNMFHINWLLRRIDENALVEPEKSFRYLKYAESILNSVKEKDRYSIYQPLLLLELALINSYNWLKEPKELHTKWLSLVERAEKYLAQNDGNLAIMHNNLGLSFAKNDDIHNAVKFFNKAIPVLKRLKDDPKRLAVNSLNNLSQTYLVSKDFSAAKKVIEETEDYIVSNSINDTQFVATFYHRKFWYTSGIKKYLEASNNCDLAIISHLSIPKNNRNDLSLDIYFNDMARVLLKLKGYKIKNANIKKVLKNYRSKSSSNSDKTKLMLEEIVFYYMKKYEQNK